MLRGRLEGPFAFANEPTCYWLADPDHKGGSVVAPNNLGVSIEQFKCCHCSSPNSGNTKQRCW